MSAQVRWLMRQGESATHTVEQVRRSLRRGRGGGVTAPVAPGSEPTTETRRRGGGGGRGLCRARPQGHRTRSAPGASPGTWAHA
jgi:hypothetical protein